MAVLPKVRPHVQPVLGQAVIECCGRTHRACKRKGAKLNLTGPNRFPDSVAAIAIHAHVYPTVGLGGDAVLGSIVERQRFTITTLEFHQPPGGLAEVGRNIRRWALRKRARNEDQDGSQKP